MTRTSTRIFSLCFILIVANGLSALAAEPLVDDPLTGGTTVGVRDNGRGRFIAGGWLVTGSSDNIRYTLPAPVEDGAVEFDISGLRFDDTRVQNHRGQLLSMYDASFGDPRHVYAPDLRKNPFKFVLHRYGRDEEAYFANHLKLIMNVDGVNQFEDYSSVGAFPWDESKTYHMRLEWRDGLIRFFIDGRDVDRWPFVYRGLLRPGIHDIRIGTNTRNNAILGAVYSNVKIFDYGVAPGAPIVTAPRDVATRLPPIVEWTGARHSHYEVRVTSTPEPTGNVSWSSGVVESPRHYAETGPLPGGATSFAHVRLHNDKGWGPWSEPRRFELRPGDRPSVPAFAEHEIVLTTSRRHTNPYTDVSLSATFTGPARSFRVNGFWDGGRLFKIRMLPTEPGEWHWTTSSSDPDLDGVSGSFLSEASSLPGYVRVSKALPHSFEWAGTGEPFFFMGDTIWHMFYNLRFFDGSFQRVIDERAAQRFNYAQGVVHDFLANEGGPIYRAQNSSRKMFDTDTLNPDYFNLIDRKIDHMNARGMVAGLFFSWGNEGYQEYETAAQYERYMRYLVARYASKNVFWILVGEFEEAGEPRSRWRDYANVVSLSDPYGHPISLHTVATTDAFGPDETHSFVSQQRFGSPQDLRRFISESRIYDKPVVNLEYGYEGDPAVFGNNQFPDEVRKDHYAITLAGGYGVYGNHTPGYSTYHRVGDFVLGATDTPGAEFLRILYDFFAGTRFERLRPAQELTSRGIAAAWDDHEYIVQLPAGGNVELDLTSAVGTYRADWFDPRTGQRSALAPVAGGGARSFGAPDGRDWILHLVNVTPPGGDPPPLLVPTLESHEARAIRVDGDPGDWDLQDFVTPVAAGERVRGDHALVGYDAGGLHVAGYATRLVLPESASDHTVRAYARHDRTSVFFLFRIEDDDLRTPHNENMNWANDAVEIYLDPGFERGAAPMNASTSDVQIVIDAANRKNVYVTTPGYRDRVLAGVFSAVSVDGAGWWLEVEIVKSALRPAIPEEGRMGVDFNFRDNDADNDPSLSTVYTWSDPERSSRFPSKIPDRWGELVLPAPGPPTLPEPAGVPTPTDGADGVGTSARLSWARAAGAREYDVHFGTPNPPPFAGRGPETAFDPGALEPETTYFWRIDSVNDAGTTLGIVWRFTTAAGLTAPTLELGRTGALQIDGRADDWGLTGRESVVRAGDAVAGDVALVGFDRGTLYWAGRGTRLGLPLSAADHTARIYARHDDNFLYFLARIDDDDIRFEHGTEMNWANDSVEIYLDPSSARAGAPMSASSSDVQLVVDANNQVNVYMTTDAYRSRILAGIVSAVSLDSTGWWLELRIAKRALEPDLPASGSFGLDFNFRDNDGGNDPALSSVYTWSDTEESGRFPSKIPDRWGTGRLR